MIFDFLDVDKKALNKLSQDLRDEIKLLMTRIANDLDDGNTTSEIVALAFIQVFSESIAVTIDSVTDSDLVEKAFLDAVTIHAKNKLKELKEKNG